MTILLIKPQIKAKQKGLLSALHRQQVLIYTSKIYKSYKYKNHFAEATRTGLREAGCHAFAYILL